ncbi:MAG TPA: SRPBCC domain-containing protein [Chitinophagaceae bacterium]|nr:SRPBCC domain-containing protein [Chitinophagaceae bacterium]
MSSQPIKQLTLTRILNAPRALVYKVWTDEKHMAEWWGPKNFTNPVCKMDVRPGGAILIHMAWPGGGPVFPMKGIFYEVEEPVKLVFSSLAFEKEDGTFGIENMNTITFEDLGNNQTKLTVHAEVFKADPEFAAALAGMDQGWSESLVKLEDLLAAIQ